MFSPVNKTYNGLFIAPGFSEFKKKIRVCMVLGMDGKNQYFLHRDVINP